MHKPAAEIVANNLGLVGRRVSQVHRTIDKPAAVRIPSHSARHARPRSRPSRVVPSPISITIETIGGAPEPTSILVSVCACAAPTLGVVSKRCFVPFAKSLHTCRSDVAATALILDAREPPAISSP